MLRLTQFLVCLYINDNAFLLSCLLSAAIGTCSSWFVRVGHLAHTQARVSSAGKGSVTVSNHSR